MTGENEASQAGLAPTESPDDLVFGISESGEFDPSLLADQSSRPIRDMNSDESNVLNTFEEADLDPRLLKVFADLSWQRPTPVQSMCLPYTLKGRDVAGFAQTGTGKTGVFLTTFAQKFLTQDNKQEGDARGHAAPFAVVLAPTRELAIQIHEDANNFLKQIGAKSIAVFGGMDYEKQASDLRLGVDLIVATPGRLKDYFQKKIVTLKNCQLFVCDEVDRMFDMGFVEDVEYFLEKIPENAQKLLFSATTNEKVKELAFEYLEKPEYISVNPEVVTPERIEQHAILCDATSKLRVMIGLLRDHNPSRAVIFVNTKLAAQWLHYKLKGNGISADIITGDLPQRKRITLIRKIKDGAVRILIATDVASRGLHISDISHVYNFDLPDEAANYVHRIGRTARAGATGVSYSLVCDEYGENYDKIRELIGDAAPRPVWFSESYLEIRDQAGNPFDDNFGVKPKESHARSPHKEPRHGDDRHQRRSGADSQRKGTQQRPQQHSSGRGPQKDQGKPHHARGPGDHKDKNRNRDRRHDRHTPATESSHLPIAAPAVPTTTTGFIKKVFSLLFGRKAK